MRKLAFALTLLFSVSSLSAGQSVAAIETTLLARLATLDKSSNYGDAPDYEKLERENDLFKKDLLRFTRLPATIAAAFPRLKKALRIVTSKDGRLRIYSWDRQTGGTMHDYDSVFQYRGASGKVFSWSENDVEDAAGVFYHEIFQVNTRSRPIYLTVATFVGSTSLRGESISAITINGDRLVADPKVIKTASGLQNSISFEYDLFSQLDRKDRRLFTFDEAKRSFSFPVVIEDEKTPQGRITNKNITYRFDGSYFVKTN
ncbi:MAG: hypothetical protein DMF63_06125 [Acidobacteria bacterium]|nr:MAG: hypothetical protein DMF63_06125 [Acidobacteriota bacterium]